MNLSVSSLWFCSSPECKNHLYRLKAVIVHCGSSEWGGHFITYRHGYLRSQTRHRCKDSRNNPRYSLPGLLHSCPLPPLLFLLFHFVCVQFVEVSLVIAQKQLFSFPRDYTINILVIFYFALFPLCPWEELLLKVLITGTGNKHRDSSAKILENAIVMIKKGINTTVR